MDPRPGQRPRPGRRVRDQRRAAGARRRSGFGYRFIADELADAGHRVSERRVWRLCNQTRIVSAHARPRQPFRSRRFVHELARQGLFGSMGRVASSADNAAMESFFALLQKNVLDARRRATRHELRLAIVTWIERTYHRRRRQRPLGKLTPIEFETINRATHAA